VFQCIGPAKVKARSPNFLLVRGCSYRQLLAERRCDLEWSEAAVVSDRDRYSGARPM